MEQGDAPKRAHVVSSPNLRRALDDPAPVRRWTSNPFYVLELPPDAAWSEIERRANDLLRADQKGAYATPAGARRRVASDIGAAVEALRDPDARIVHELWASVPARACEGDHDSALQSPAWRDAMTAFGWRQR